MCHAPARRRTFADGEAVRAAHAASGLSARAFARLAAPGLGLSVLHVVSIVRGRCLATPGEDRPPARTVCRHCRRAKVNRPRGLCWGCFHAPGVRDLYPVAVTRHTRRGAGNGFADRPPPDRPTDTRPGTPERVAVYAARAAAETGLYHPADYRGET